MAPPVSPERAAGPESVESASATHGWQIALRVVLGVGAVGYPVLVWFGLTHWSVRTLATVMICILAPTALLRFRAMRRATSQDPVDLRSLAAIPLVTLAALGLALALDSGGYVLMVPVGINAALLVGFGGTLRSGTVPMIERFARLHEADLQPAKQAWCRSWTITWCAFFILNGGTAAALALLAPLAWWATYTGLISYALMGLLFATEWVLRHRRFPVSSTGDEAEGQPEKGLPRV